MDALLIIDFQNDFCPGGALAVDEGDRIVEAVDPLLDRFELVVATRDWHPRDHGSFAGVEVDPATWCGPGEPSIWPVHCVQGTHGAELHPGLDRARLDLLIHTGQDAMSEGYSAFQDTALGDLLRERAVERLVVAGLATDYCVKHTVLDALRQGFDVTVVEDGIRAVDVQPGDGERAIEDMRAAGADFVPSGVIAALRPVRA